MINFSKIVFILSVMIANNGLHAKIDIPREKIKFLAEQLTNLSQTLLDTIIYKNSDYSQKVKAFFASDFVTKDLIVQLEQAPVDEDTGLLEEDIELTIEEEEIEIIIRYLPEDNGTYVLMIMFNIQGKQGWLANSQEPDSSIPIIEFTTYLTESQVKESLLNKYSLVNSNDFPGVQEDTFSLDNITDITVQNTTVGRMQGYSILASTKND